MQYRKEIDGLRAVAVVPVVLFHAGTPWVGGGYVGVDVFFVISGYLITSLILQDEHTGKFSLIRFYERRARRILPALFAMMLACIPFAYFLMSPAELKYFGEGIGSVSLFASNVLFFSHGGYFSAPTALNPLVHTWSLAVEEQFYLLYPLMLVVVWRWGRTPITLLIVAIALLSFGFAHLGGSFSREIPFVVRDWKFAASSFCFYLTPARAWELMAGALVAIWSPDRIEKPRILTEVGAAIGLAAILVAIFGYSADTPFPSYYTLLPVLGTVFVVLFGGPTNWTGRLLSQPLFVGVGLISYSVYIWHLPMLAFARLYSTTELSTWLASLLAILSLPAGYLSWKYIETSFRANGVFTRRQIFSFAAMGSLLFIALGCVFLVTDGLLFRFPQRDWPLMKIDPTVEGLEVFTNFNAYKGAFESDGRRKLLLIGDSFAGDFTNMIVSNKLLGQYQIRTVNIPAKCQILLTEPDAPLCQRHTLFDADVQAKIKQADVVILAASWVPESASRLKATLAASGITGSHKRIFVIGAKRFGDFRPLSFLPLSTAQRIAFRNPIEHVVANDILRKQFQPSEFVDVIAVVCGKGATTCPAFTPQGDPISFDGYHLTPAGAKYVGHLLFSAPPLNSLMRN